MPTAFSLSPMHEPVAISRRLVRHHSCQLHSSSSFTGLIRLAAARPIFSCVIPAAIAGTQQLHD
jgi:hypothetical protein